LIISCVSPGSAAPSSPVERDLRKPPANPTPAETTADAADSIKDANAVTLIYRCSQDLQDLWREWKTYRTERATTGPKSKRLPWTAQAARMTAKQIEAAITEHAERMVCDRIRSAIAGSWQGLNLDKMEGRACGTSRPRGTPSSVPGINNRRGAAL
jgi:hypothetical protein